jgi:hypothetical protein
MMSIAHVWDSIEKEACSKRFTYKFPEGSKKRIVDVNENRTQKQHRKEGETSNEHSGGVPSGADSAGEAMDAGAEDGIGRHVLKQARMRLTVERALED